MLYVFKAPFILCQSIEKACSGCTKALNDFCTASCTGVAKCLEETCGGVCKGVSCVFEGIAKCLGGIVFCFMATITGIIKFFCSCIRCDQPLGFFVICALLFNGPAAYIDYTNYADGGCLSETGPLVVAIVALVNIFVAIYLKKKVNYMPSPESDPLEDELSPEAMVTKQQKVTKEKVFEKINYMLLYDVTFCLYIFGFAAAWMYTCINAFRLGDCDRQGHVLVIMYGPFTTCYCGCFYCYAGSSAAISAISKGNNKKKPAGNLVADANKHLLTNQR